MNAHSNLEALIGLAALALALFIGALLVQRGERPRPRRIYDVQRERASYDAIAGNAPQSDTGLRLRRRRDRL